MKNILSITACFLITSITSIAQNKKTYIVKPGEKVKEAIPNQAMYMYPKFKDGIVNFKNNHVGAAKLNYNHLLDAIEFIDDKGDTLSLNNELTISSINIDRDTFYYYQGFVKLMKIVKNIQFASKKILALSNRQKIGGMGELSSASIATYDKLNSSYGIKDVIPKEILTFSEYVYFFIGDNYNHFKPLNKKSLLHMYSRQQNIVESYLRENSINFLNENDVKKLTDFLNTL